MFLKIYKYHKAQAGATDLSIDPVSNMLGRSLKKSN
jgi:hypothetical protein